MGIKPSNGLDPPAQHLYQEVGKKDYDVWLFPHALLKKKMHVQYLREIRALAHHRKLAKSKTQRYANIFPSVGLIKLIEICRILSRLTRAHDLFHVPAFLTSTWPLKVDGRVALITDLEPTMWSYD